MDDLGSVVGTSAPILRLKIKQSQNFTTEFMRVFEHNFSIRYAKQFNLKHCILAFKRLKQNLIMVQRKHSTLIVGCFFICIDSSERFENVTYKVI